MMQGNPRSNFCNAKFGPRSNCSNQIWTYSRNIFCKMGPNLAGTIPNLVGKFGHVARSKFAMTDPLLS